MANNIKKRLLILTAEIYKKQDLVITFSCVWWNIFLID